MCQGTLWKNVVIKAKKLTTNQQNKDEKWRETSINVSSKSEKRSTSQLPLPANQDGSGGSQNNRKYIPQP